MYRTQLVAISSSILIRNLTKATTMKKRLPTGCLFGLTPIAILFFIAPTVLGQATNTAGVNTSLPDSVTARVDALPLTYHTVPVPLIRPNVPRIEDPWLSVPAFRQVWLCRS
jgi:hypothetical protein